MAKVGRFFKKVWGKVWPVVERVEPVASTIVKVIDPKLAPAIFAGETVVGAIKGAHH